VKHCAALAFMSDEGMLATMGQPLFANDPSFTPIMATSLDHNIYFHRLDFRADQWLLFHSETTVSAGCRCGRCRYFCSLLSFLSSFHSFFLPLGFAALLLTLPTRCLRPNVSFSHCRGLASTQVFTQEGKLVATMIQEGLIRPAPPKM
jgi:acyl-CoA thioesterase